MIKFLKFLIPVVVLGGVVYHFRSTIFPPAPCAEPIAYTLGTFDTKFNITEKYFLSALNDAEAIWEKSFGKELFNYAPEDPSNILKVNLIYDYRQQATSKLASLGITVKDTRASYDTLKAKFDALKTEYNQEKVIFKEKVTAWNKTDRTDRQQYDELQTIEAELNKKVDEINALVVALNRLVTNLNLSVDKYNTVNGSRGESFEEGVYVEEGFNKYIDIYEFSDREKLVRVLAHELGHALGLDHVEDGKAIMYKLNQGRSQKLTEADLTELKTKCQIQ